MSFRNLGLAGLVLAALVFPTVAASAPVASTTTVKLVNVSHHQAPILKAVKVQGTLAPAPTPGQKIKLVLLRNGHPYQHRVVNVDATTGKFKGTMKGIKTAGRFRIMATHATSPELEQSDAKTDYFKITFPTLRQGNHGPKVKLFNRLLHGRGYLASGTSRYNAITGRGVVAFRKVNGMRRVFSFATPQMFRMLAAGQGGYRVRHPGAGQHAEVSLSRQVLVLADGAKVHRVYHVSTGKPSTPTIRGVFNFYRRQPGTNGHGMFDSFYFHGGYAVHGYPSVPTFAASHGCVRTPNADAPGIYHWLRMGMAIYIS